MGKTKEEELRRLSWMSTTEQNIKKFESVVSDHINGEEYFNTEFLERLSARIERLSSFNFKVSIIYVILLLSLYSAIVHPELNLNVLGFQFSNLAKAKEFLLALIAAILPIKVIYSNHETYLKEVVKMYIRTRVNGKVHQKLYSLSWLDDFEFGGEHEYDSDGRLSIYNHKFKDIIIFGSAISLGIYGILLCLTVVYLEIAVIYDVATNPSASKTINLFVVIFACISLLSSWFMILSKIKLPMINVDYYDKLNSLEISNPDKYNELMNKQIKSRERQVIVTSMISSIVIFCVVYLISIELEFIVALPETLKNTAFVVLGMIVVSFSSLGLCDEIRQRLMSYYFNKHKGKDHTYKIFRRYNRFLNLSRFLIPFIASVAFLDIVWGVNILF